MIEEKGGSKEDVIRREQHEELFYRLEGAAETWTDNECKRDKERMSADSRRNKIRNEVILVHEMIEEARMRWYGHAMKTPRNRWEEQITESVQVREE
uniref:Uncharacterized protein n=1 Tax=Timema tahoe TaxID=61484 RepID=A0A7R9ILJ2_9NEOP|nr:unnamed protein product [Timema tahoe]